MDTDFIRRRISQLRLQKGVSEYKMSFDLGHSKGYIQSISSGRALPSLPELLYICEYFGVTPAAFFDAGAENPILLSELLQKTERLSQKDMELLLRLAERLGEQGE